MRGLHSGGRIVTRAEWGARPPLEESALLPDLLPMLFLHHSAMTECEDPPSCEERQSQASGQGGHLSLYHKDTGRGKKCP